MTREKVNKPLDNNDVQLSDSDIESIIYPFSLRDSLCLNRELSTC